jgi:hypothetical protein
MRPNGERPKDGNAEAENGKRPPRHDLMNPERTERKSPENSRTAVAGLSRSNRANLPGAAAGRAGQKEYA